MLIMLLSVAEDRERGWGDRAGAAGNTSCRALQAVLWSRRAHGFQGCCSCLELNILRHIVPVSSSHHSSAAALAEG